MDIPVYLVAGFLDSGKTSFINGILEDGFAREDKTLLICCEEGDEEYEKKALDNVTVVKEIAAREVYEQLLRIGEGDLIIGISFPRYSSLSLIHI